MRGRSSTTMTARVKQAAASTQKLYHAHAGGTPSEGGDETTSELEFSVYTTIVLAMIVVGLGAGMATIFLKIHFPDCLNGSYDASSNVSSNVRRMLRGAGSTVNGLIAQVDLGNR